MRSESSRGTNGIFIKSPRELALMRKVGKVLAVVKARLEKEISTGITTTELDKIAESEIRRLGARPSFKGYRDYPASICVSINEEIVHGIPSQRLIKEGDVVSVDLGAYMGGFHSDCAFTKGAGKISPKAQDLIETTREALNIAIQKVKPGARIGDISAAIQALAEGRGYNVVRQYVGHGIGRSLHEDPQVPNFGLPGRGPILKTGMVLAIEPMLNVGTWETRQLDDGWTVVTADNALSAHFEHTVAVTETGYEILSQDNGLE